MRRIYLDHAATTPADERVAAAMLPYLTDNFGNAHSLHAFGRRAAATVDEARDKVASLLGAKPREIYFTSGGTEADNWALRGAARAGAAKGRHVVLSAVEHPAVRAASRRLAEEGFEVSAAPVGADGVLDLPAFASLLREDTVLAAVMAVNNETGAVQPLAEVSRLCRARGVLLFCDAVQAAGAYPLDVNAPPVDLLSISAHKFYGPKGVGALYVREGVRIAPLVTGGEQERGLRGGTTNVAGAVGMAEALSLARAELSAAQLRAGGACEAFVRLVLAEAEGARLNGPRQACLSLASGGRLYSLANFSFADVDGPALLALLDRLGVAASGGSACSSGSPEPSPVLAAMGLPASLARSGVRFSFGKENTEADAAEAFSRLRQALARLRAR